jgi:hypothetical protein
MAELVVLWAIKAAGAATRARMSGLNLERAVCLAIMPPEDGLFGFCDQKIMLSLHVSQVFFHHSKFGG